MSPPPIILDQPRTVSGPPPVAVEPLPTIPNLQSIAAAARPPIPSELPVPQETPKARIVDPQPIPVATSIQPGLSLVAEHKLAPQQVIETPLPAPTSSANHPKKKKSKSGLIPVMLVLFLLFGAIGAAVVYVSNELGKHTESPKVTITKDPAVSEANYIRIGWQKEAYQVLNRFLAGTTSEEKLPYILNADRLKTKVTDFYGGGTINDSDTPAEAFSIYELSEEDRKRGLFMMIYDQPPQFDMKEFFRPLASLEVQYGVEDADLLLSTMARVGNFAMEPLRVHAFFKRTDSGLKLDWEVFVQTKYRTFQNFVELPEAGQSAVFRVFIVEDVPEKGRAVAGTRTYRLADPANTGDTARVNVKIDSEAGRVLSIINWRNTKDNHPVTRTATVELKWTGESNAPMLEISHFICWEFLGLGGQKTSVAVSTQ